MILRLISYRAAPDQAIQVGALVGDRPYDLAQAVEAAGIDGPACQCLRSVAELLACEECLEVARCALEDVDEALALADVELLAPIPC
ncbi:MAG: hypothetical protein AB7Y46_15565, partial [Armatimonadota bacterium]